ncbi:MAG: TRAP transporter fused permease subunit [Beijerinckiaceae bacterium]|nr:TRAP transporter fused permease subunit [Beijerinckiaceae bacterium]
MAKTKLLTVDFWFSVGVRREPKGWLSWVLTPMAVALAVYVILAATYIIIQPWVLTATFLSGMMTIAFVAVGATANSDPEQPSVFDYILSAASLACGIYFAWNAEIFINRITGMEELAFWDMFFGSVMVFLTLEITRRSTGIGLLTVVVLFMLYNLFGHLLGGVIKHGYISPNWFVEKSIFTTEGVMGLPARVAATYAFMFVLFGTLLHLAKGSDFFFDIASALTGKSVGGPAKIAVISSGLYGMISGSPTSDVVTTGSLTIPMMKRLGYPGTVAGGIEVAASTGGSVMPPVLGSAAFLMAEYTGIEYRDIAIAALLPALLYYLCVYSQVHFRAVRLGMTGLDPDKIPAIVPVLKHGGMFLVPLVVLTWALLSGYTPTMVAVYGSLAVIAVSFIRRDTWLHPLKLWQALAETTYRMVAVAGATAAAGLVIGGLAMTGLDLKVAHLIYAITLKQQFMTMVVGALLALILGLGMPTPSAYILAAVLLGPVMTQVGVDILAGHLFLLYFAVMSALTPPVAVAAYAASSISGDNPLATAAQAVKLALAAFVVPFVFVFGPELLWKGPLWKTGVTFVTAAMALVLLAGAIEHYSKWADTWWQRILLAIGALFMLAPPLWSVGVGIVIVAVAISLTRLTSVKGRAA